MQEISLENQPNQEFNITLNNVPFRIALRYLEAGCTLADIYASDNPVMLGVLCRANEFLIPYPYLAQNGNFVFLSDDDDYPVYTNFGKSCKLYFLTPDEINGNNQAGN